MHPIDRRFYLAGGVLLFAVLCAAALAVPKYIRPHATTIIVTNTSDNGPGSLRQAIADAQGGDTIAFDPALNGQSIFLSSGELAIDKDLTITGPGLNLLTLTRAQQTPQFRILHIMPDSVVAINGLTISSGYADGDGGGVLNDHGTVTIDHCAVVSNGSSYGEGGGIANVGSGGKATLTIRDSLIGGNIASAIGGGVADGGGIANYALNGIATMTIINSTVNNNIAVSDSAFNISGSGGGIANDGMLNVVDSSITHNTAGRAYGPPFPGGNSGGIANGGTLEIVNSTISDNRSGLNTGGISNSGTLTITNCNVTNNLASGEHDGIFYGYSGGIANGGTLTIRNCTIAANSAPQLAGGISNIGKLTITRSTISGNSSGGGGGILNNGGMLEINESTLYGNSANQIESNRGGGIATSGSTTISNSTLSSNSTASHGGAISNAGTGTILTITNSTVNGNGAGQGGAGIYNADGAIFEIENTILKTGAAGDTILNSGGTVTSRGYNLTSDNGGGFLTGPGDQINTDPILGPLQDNGGPTFTHLLLKGSPAINMGDPNFTPPPLTDQRGYLRVYDGRIDIGSVEVQPVPTPSPSPSSSPSSSPTPSPTASCAARDLPDCYDFMVDVTDSPDPVQAGEELTYSIVVSVYGTLYPNYIQMTDTLPAGVELVSATTNDGGCSGTSTITCNLNFQWPYGDQALVTLVVRPTVAGTINNTVNIDVGDKDPSNNTDTVTTTVIPGPTPTPTPTSTPTPSTRLLNISTRLHVGTGDDVGIGGFIIAPSINSGPFGPSKGGGGGRTYITGLGPSLGNFGIPDFLTDPTLELHNGSGGLIYYNNNWRDDPVQAAQIKALGDPRLNDLESAIIWTLEPGSYTVVLAGREGRTGTGLVEIFDISGQFFDSQLGNISTRGFVGTDENVMIGGFILGNSINNAQIAVRGVGPSLTNFGVPNALTDPTLELRDDNGALIVANDNWQDDPKSAAQLIAHGLAPQNSLESGIFLELQPNLYTAILAGKNGGVGVGLVEIYNLH